MECLGDNTASNYLTGHLDKDGRIQVEDHVANCAECRQLIALLAQMETVATQASGPSVTIAEIDIQPGMEVGRFKVIGHCGKGGMGVVFSAYDPHLERKVAIKFVRCARSGKRLVREARAIAQLSHPNIVTIYDVGQHRDQVYIAMEFVEGSTLGEWLRAWKPDSELVLARYLDAADALSAAHARGVLHRDFKPDNVLLGEDGRVRVSDFGLAGKTRVPEDHLFVDAANQPAIVGTPRYMAPEQRAGEATDARADQYSFCVALYEGLWGSHPYRSGGKEQPEHTEVRRPKHLKRRHRALFRVLTRGLARKPSQRFATMDALKSAIVLATARTQTSRRPTHTAFAAIAFIATLSYAAVSMHNQRVDQRERDRLRQALAASDAQLTQTRAQLLALQTSVRATNARRQDTPTISIHESLRKKRPASREDETITLQAVSTTETAPRLADLVAKTATRQVVLPDRQNLEQPGEINTATELAPPSKVVGSRLADRLARRIRTQKADLMGCTNEWRSRHPDRGLTLRVEIHVTDSGRLTHTFPIAAKDRVLYECISETLKRVDYPRSRRGIRARADFNGFGDDLAIGVHKLIRHE